MVLQEGQLLKIESNTFGLFKGYIGVIDGELHIVITQASNMTFTSSEINNPEMKDIVEKIKENRSSLIDINY